MSNWDCGQKPAPQPVLNLWGRSTEMRMKLFHHRKTDVQINEHVDGSENILCVVVLLLSENISKKWVFIISKVFNDIYRVYTVSITLRCLRLVKKEEKHVYIIS